MHLENFIQFIIRHNALIIEGLVGLIVLFVLVLSYRTFLSARAAEKSGHAGAGLPPSMGELEETLKKLLEKANSLPAASAATSAAVTAAGGADTAPLLEEIQELKKSLETRQTEIETLKTQAPAAGAAGATAAPGMSSDDKAALEAQLRELQGKLAEYEIISEDIADLSFYKEENARLQKQLEASKGAGAPVAAAPAPEPAAAPVAPEPAAPAPPPPPPKVEPEIVGRTRSAPAEEAPEPVPAAVPEVADDDLMKEFAAAVEEQQVTEPTKPHAQDDALSEFEAAASMAASGSAAVAETAAEVPAANLDLGEMDLDKMVAEATRLETLKADETASNALETGMDSNKLLEEAASMEAVQPGDAQLMGDFEKFVKKGG